jgi:hypothetical protein
VQQLHPLSFNYSLGCNLSDEARPFSDASLLF